MSGVTVPARQAHQDWLSRGREGPGRIDLDGANLIAARLSGAVLTGARLQRCTLDGADLSLSALEELEWIDCTAREVKLVGSQCGQSRFVRCSLVNANLTL